ncbi:uncharacterized protein (DUF302 family) [Natronocella acetinitrilica]|jgi:uncharacterized protein (DUF302 family)|uniref:Uncharacterized protein (DUF302 family) n=1 Tax=Natronocella acetinitrilica TaxID=414046 RepID=A0AAE3G6N7_9GAMM|nr:DUF302 domain-containing protein [Natronocella acetinitrilica]MCP1676412.1 uncharacterized protein (DUF302 family) [Natronocella acetinitrilica]
MKRFLTSVALAAAMIGSAQAADGLTAVESEHDLDTTVERLLSALDEAGMNVFGEVDHAAGAERAGMTLDPTYLVMFGNPEVGTRLMECGRSVAIDLPMKALIWEEDGTVYIGYNDAEYLADRHGLVGCDQVLEQVSGALNRFATHAAGQ